MSQITKIEKKKKRGGEEKEKPKEKSRDLGQWDGTGGASKDGWVGFHWGHPTPCHGPPLSHVLQPKLIQTKPKF